MFAGQLVLFCGTKQPLFSGQKAKAPPPPPAGLPKGASSGKRATSILLRKGFQHLWHLFVCHRAITCHKVAPTLLSPSLALMLGSTP